MTDDLHPYWQTDEEAPVPVRPVSEQPTQRPPAMPENARTVSRKPAALAGIALAVLLSGFFYAGIERLTGQLVSSTITIRITDKGIDPIEVTAPQGSTIKWINEQSVPQILESKDLCAKNNCLYTPNIFQGDNATFAITTDVQPGKYIYTSITTPAFKGIVTVTGPSSSSSATTSSAAAYGTSGVADDADLAEDDEFLEDDLLDEEPAVPASSAGAVPAPLAMPALPPPATLAASSSSPAALIAAPVPSAVTPPSSSGIPATTTPPEDVLPPPTDVGTYIPGIPTNPNTVGSNRLVGSVIPESDATHAGAPRTYVPISQPQTGSNLWIIAGLSMIAFAWATRRCFVRARKAA